MVYCCNNKESHLRGIDQVKRFWFMIVGILLLLGISGTANAGPIDLTNTVTFTKTGTSTGVPVSWGYGDANILDGLGDYLTWTHEFTFDPPAASILSATLTITFIDDEEDVPSFFNINGTREYVAGLGEDWTWDIGEINKGSYPYSVNVAYLADGKFNVSLLDISGDVQVANSVLDIKYNPVPDSGSAALLLGLGVGGIALFSRKFRQ